MQVYDEMVDSGIKVVGKIPKDWKSTQLKYIASSMVSGATPTSTDDSLWNYDEGIPWVNIADIIDLKGVSKTKKRLTEKGLHSKNMVVQPAGSILFSIFASLGKMGRLEIDAVTNQAIVAISLSPRKVNDKFIFYYLSFIRNYLKYYASSNTQDNINETKLKNLDIVAPDINAQQKIADFLDVETAKIDNLIAKQECLLKLLEEKRRATITHAVTRGLDPGVLFGYVRLKNVAHAIGRGASPDYDDNGEARFINQACVYWDGLRLGGMKQASSKSHKPGGRGSLKLDDILINSTGTGTLGRAAIFNQDGSYFADSHVTVLRPKIEKVSPLYVRYMLESVYMQDMIYELCVSGSTNQIELSKERFSNLRVRMPSLDTQKKIAAQLDEDDKKLNSLKQKIQTQITLLRERRTSLISHAVTGKVKIT